jgi:hypothetical protein
MPSPQKIPALILLLFAATALAGRKSHKNSRPGQPWAACDIKGGDVRDGYTLRGSNWNITEAELKAAINTPAGTVLTAWQWNSSVKDHDPRVQTFEAKVRSIFLSPASMGISSLRAVRVLISFIA